MLRSRACEISDRLSQDFPGLRFPHFHRSSGPHILQFGCRPTGRSKLLKRSEYALFRKLQMSFKLRRCRSAAQPAVHETGPFAGHTTRRSHVSAGHEADSLPAPRAVSLRPGVRQSWCQLCLPASQPHADIRPGWPAFWPHNSAQRRRLLPSDDQHSSRVKLAYGPVTDAPANFFSADQKVEQRPEYPTGGAARSI